MVISHSGEPPVKKDKMPKERAHVANATQQIKRDE